jgi:hypothetical protein
MTEDAPWLRMITEAMNSPPRVLRALTPVQRLQGLTRPAVADCDDDHRYVIKGRQAMRPLIADQVVGRLGAIIGAPVPDVQLVEVPSELIMPGSFFEHFEAGISHGVRFVEKCSDSWYVQYVTDEGNMERFAALAVLYGWTDPEDRQFLYLTTAPHRVFSADHGAFFSGSSGLDRRILEERATGRNRSVDHHFRRRGSSDPFGSNRSAHAGNRSGHRKSRFHST